jgi:hypothetical protein
VKLVAKAGNDRTPEDEADVAITASVDDAVCAMWPQPPERCVTGSDGPVDYRGPMLLTINARITDMASGSLGRDPATVQDVELDAPITCTQTFSQTLGGSCRLTTTAETLTPGIWQEEKRTVVAALGIRIDDPGPDFTVSSPSCPPTCGTGDESTSFVQGFFAP